MDVYASPAAVARGVAPHAIGLVAATIALLVSPNPIITSVAVAVLLSAAGAAAVYLRRHIRRGPHLTINDAGILDHRGTVGLIPWTKIRVISKHHDGPSPVLRGDHLRVSSPVLDHLSFVSRKLSDVEHETDWEGPVETCEMIVKFRTLGKSTDDVWPYIKAACTRNGFTSGDQSAGYPCLVNRSGWGTVKSDMQPPDRERSGADSER